MLVTRHSQNQPAKRIMEPTVIFLRLFPSLILAKCQFKDFTRNTEAEKSCDTCRQQEQFRYRQQEIQRLNIQQTRQ